jgi:hypothetical protein
MTDKPKLGINVGRVGELFESNSASREFDSSQVYQKVDSSLFVDSASLITCVDTAKGSHMKYFPRLRIQEKDSSDFRKVMNRNELDKNHHRI